ncbi:MAG: hypothetical protein LBB21_02545 [Holosporaceae bacterium]|jgi:hypothetical protein|nr:hypothetical protein [Holosporaceae bacterium]
MIDLTALTLDFGVIDGVLFIGDACATDMAPPSANGSAVPDAEKKGLSQNLKKNTKYAVLALVVMRKDF